MLNIPEVLGTIISDGPGGAEAASQELLSDGGNYSRTIQELFRNYPGTIQELSRNILLPVLLSVRVPRHRPPPCSQSLLSPYLVTFSPSLPLTSTCLRAGGGGVSPQRAEKSACSPVLIQPPSGDGGFDRDKVDGGLRVKDSDNIWLNAN